MERQLGIAKKVADCLVKWDIVPLPLDVVNRALSFACKMIEDFRMAAEEGIIMTFHQVEVKDSRIRPKPSRLLQRSTKNIRWHLPDTPPSYHPFL